MGRAYRQADERVISGKSAANQDIRETDDLI